MKERILRRPHKHPTAHCGLCGGSVPLRDDYEDKRTVDGDGIIYHTACWNKAEIVEEKDETDPNH